MKSNKNNYILRIINKLLTRDPVFIFMHRISKSRILVLSILMGLVHLAIWMGVSTVVYYQYPGKADVYFYDLSELSFGIFLWGILVPIFWWYYLSLPKIWNDVIHSLQKEKLVDKGILNVIFQDFSLIEDNKRTSEDASKEVPKKSLTFLALLLALLAGALYLFIAIPAEIKSGRVSFWFVTGWTKLTMTALFTITTYVLFSFVLDTILLSVRLGAFFDKKGVIIVKIFHADSCGGFGLIGSLAIRLSSLAVLIGVWALWYSFLPKSAGGNINFDITVLLIFAAYIVLVPLLLLLVTWPVHKAMKKYKFDYQNQVCSKLEGVFNSVINTASEEPDSDKYKENLDRYKDLLPLYEKVIAIPTWPISLDSFRKFTGFASLPGIIGFMSFVFDVAEKIK